MRARHAHKHRAGLNRTARLLLDQRRVTSPEDTPDERRDREAREALRDRTT